MAGASVAHVGFGIASGWNPDLFIQKRSAFSLIQPESIYPFDPKSKENPLENLTLIKNVKTDMGKYYATYLSNDSVNKAGNIIYFKINFQDKKTGESFDLWPNLIKNTKGR